MKESAVLARKYGVHLHTHLAETQDEEEFASRNSATASSLHAISRLVGEDVWFAHSVHVSQEEIEVYAKKGCGVAPCPSANMRLACGIAPLRVLLAAKVKVGLGVDGSASNDGSSMLAEARQAMLLARLKAGLEGASLSSTGEEIFTARQALEVATRGGAAVLGRTDIGSLETGKCADFVGFKLNHLEFAGALHDPLAALVFCQSRQVDMNYVHGKAVVKEGRLTGLDLAAHIEKHNQAAKRLLN
jgi:cytosine/adenosine deaminase-related metal-dependent hydrolase